MADKNFKVKSGLQVPSLTTAGPVVTDNAGNVTSSSTLPISQGGTGQTTAGNALNALLPIQGAGNVNKYLQTNGTTTQWNAVTQQTVTDALAGTNIYTGTTAPTSPTTGDIWIDNTTGNGIQLVRWRKTIASGTSTISGLDDNNLTLTYTAGNEQVYINGVLITRGQDYTATNGTSISLTQAVEVGDTVEIFGNPLFSVTDTYTQAQANNLYVAKSGYDVAGKNKLINGAFDIWQRGTTFSSGLINYFAGDRWKITYDDSGGMLTASRVDISSLNIGFKYAVSIKNTGGYAGNANVRMQQAFETHDTHMMRGKTYTLSLYARKISGTNARITHMPGWTTTETSTFGSSDEIQITVPSSSLTGAFQRFSQTFVASTNASYNSMKVQIDFQYLNNLNDELQVTGVQLEEGSIATSFSRACGNIQAELATCQRYFQTILNSAEAVNGYENFGLGLVWATNRVLYNRLLPITMRVSPSISLSTVGDITLENATVGGVQATNYDFFDQSPRNFSGSFYCAGTPFTIGQGARMRASATTNARIYLSAEI